MSYKPFIGFVGNINAGKSTLINKLYDLKEEVTTTHTTKDSRIVLEDSNKIVVDFAGSNEVSSMFLLPFLEKVAYLDKCIILYPDSIITSQAILLLAINLAKEIVVVCTKCDKHIKCLDIQEFAIFKDEQNRLMKEILTNIDNTIVRNIKGIYFISAKNTEIGELSNDYNELRNLCLA